MLKSGDVAPPFSLKDHQGQTRSLSDYAGKTLVLWFYPKADTPGCTAEGCAFRDLAADYEKKGAAILGASFDNQEENADFARKFHFNFPLLCDVERSLGLAYGACDEPAASNARRIGVVIGPDGKVKHYFPKVSAKDFPGEALALV